jgi:hypothetical protein
MMIAGSRRQILVHGKLEPGRPQDGSGKVSHNDGKVAARSAGPPRPSRYRTCHRTKQIRLKIKREPRRQLTSPNRQSICAGQAPLQSIGRSLAELANQPQTTRDRPVLTSTVNAQTGFLEQQAMC